MIKRTELQGLHKALPKPKARVGAKELLTKDLAQRIALMVAQFPDAGIPVTWECVIQQTKRRFGKEFRRNVLSTKKWDGRALVADAFHDAKAIQKRLGRDTAQKYANEPRSRLRQLVAKLQAQNLALMEQLSNVRAMQYDEIHSLLDTRTPLNQLIAMKSSATKAANLNEGAEK